MFMDTGPASFMLIVAAFLDCLQCYPLRAQSRLVLLSLWSIVFPSRCILMLNRVSTFALLASNDESTLEVFISYNIDVSWKSTQSSWPQKDERILKGQAKIRSIDAYADKE